jgi:hypothetical protein
MCAAVAFSLASQVGCLAMPATGDWYDQLSPDGACYRVDLLDGLDESSTTELHDLFACVNDAGQLDPLAPVMTALDSATRTGEPAGLVLAQLVNDLPEIGVDLFAAAGDAASALADSDLPVREVLDLTLEALYGTRATKVRGAGVSLTDPQALDGGLIAPAEPLIGVATGVMLSDLDAHTTWLADLLRDPEVDRWLRTGAALVHAPDDQVEASLDGLLVDVGAAVTATRSPANDRWEGASGDSARDAVDHLLLAPDAPLVALGPDLAEILGDVVVRMEVAEAVVRWEAQGHLAPLAEQVAWLASVDVYGAPLEPGGTSGLSALVRLLHDTHQPMTCTFDLWVTDLEVDLGDLAVAFLQALSEQDPAAAADGLSLLSDLLGWEVSDLIITEIADSGVCPVLTPQVAEDLHTVDLIVGPQAADLLVVFIEALDMVRHGEQDHLLHVADLAAELHTRQALPPLEELLRDLGSSPAIDRLLALAPVLVDPEGHGVLLADTRPVDLQDVLSLGLWLLDDEGGGSGWAELEPRVEPLLAHDATWKLLGNAASLLSEETSQAAQLLDLVPVPPEAPELELRATLAELLQNRALIEPALVLAESAPVSALLSTEPEGESAEVPLAFTARLILDSTLEDLLAVVDLALGAFDR